MAPGVLVLEELQMTQACNVSKPHYLSFFFLPSFSPLLPPIRDRIRAHLPASHRHRGSILREAPDLRHRARCMRVRGRPLCPRAAHRIPVGGLRKARRLTRRGGRLPGRHRLRGVVQSTGSASAPSCGSYRGEYRR